MVATSGNSLSGGAIKSFLALCVAMKKDGLNFMVWLPSHGIVEQECKRLGLQYICFREYGGAWLKRTDGKNQWFIAQLKRLLNYYTFIKCKIFLKRNNPAFIHINAVTGGYTIARAAEKLNIPVIWHIREFMEEDLSLTFRNKKKIFSILNKAQCFIAISKEIEKKWQKKLAPHIYVVYNGIETNKYEVKKKKAHKLVNIIMYGRIDEGKNQLFFLKAIATMSPKVRKNCHFFLAGSNQNRAYFNKCMQYISDAGINKYVTYLGEISNIKKLLSTQDIACVCSKKEGFGRVNVEAIMGKCIVVAADAGASKEIIHDGKNGYIYAHDDLDDFKNKLYSAILNKDKFNYAENQAEIRHQFSAENNERNIVKVYEKNNLL